MSSEAPRIGRRHVLRLGTSGLAAAALAGCGSPSKRTTSPTAEDSSTGSAAGQVLLVFFSRAGENYFNGGRIDLQVGNTEVAAGMIRDALACDVYQILASEPYSESYDTTVQRNVREQNDAARPGIANSLASLDAYSTILLGSPIWNVRAPRIMLSFAEQFDFSGKTLLPFTTYAVSGLGSVVEEYRAACRGAVLGEALAIRGEEVSDSRSMIESWLKRTKLLA